MRWRARSPVPERVFTIEAVLGACVDFTMPIRLLDPSSTVHPKAGSYHRLRAVCHSLKHTFCQTFIVFTTVLIVDNGSAIFSTEYGIGAIPMGRNLAGSWAFHARGRTLSTEEASVGPRHIVQKATGSVIPNQYETMFTNRANRAT
ncbi:hypothetical protein FNAPI_3682 [Fusarium napiforme]|uniref:Uncharacterized protein n=1 Tax=Fusarium napiforme TaxID=42672 RepID=A0A8H5JTF0_9HYPO|nr:hypothetical protein FNAPI_3682 [Fusarium napiforme]